jgi:hypothetical protein
MRKHDLNMQVIFWALREGYRIIEEDGISDAIRRAELNPIHSSSANILKLLP